MTTFESVHEARIAGKLVAFDRLTFKGHMNSWMPKGAFARFLFVQGVLLTGFKAYVARVTGELKAHAMAYAKKAGRPYEYLAGAYTASRGRSKEERAREIAARDDIREGLITVFAAVEPWQFVRGAGQPRDAPPGGGARGPQVSVLLLLHHGP